MDFIAEKVINLDFIRSKYVSVNAKQFDKSGRSIEIVCTNNGKKVVIDRIKNYAFVRYRRSDGYGIVDSCEITNDGKIIFIPTKEMLDIAGKSYADIVLVKTDSPRSPIANNGFFVADCIYDKENKSIEFMFSPSTNITYENNDTLSMKTINYNGNTINICSNPAPFVVYNNPETLTFATIDKFGNITMENPSILSTMTLCVNVIDASFYGDCLEILR